MIFEEFNPKIHDYHKVAELMYSVDFRTYSEVFKTEKNAILAIEDLLLIEAEGKENLDDSPFQVYVILENSEDRDIDSDSGESKSNNDSINNINNIIGILQIVKGKKINLIISIFYFLINLKLVNALRFSYLSFLDSLVLSDFRDDDLYLAEIAIDQKKQGKGIGKKIIKKVIEKARENRFKRVILDVDLRNTGVIKLYESIGFKIFDKKSPKLFKKERGMCNMEYIL